MARTVTLANLRTRVLQRANLEFASNNALLASGNTELDSNINEGIADFWLVIAEFPDQEYALNQTTFTTTAAKQIYNIGAGLDINITDFFKPQGIDVQFGQNLVNTARPFMWEERNRFKVLYSGWVYTQPIFYRAVGLSIWFIPTPSGSFSVTLNYMPTSPVLVNASDTFDGIQGFEEYVVLSAAIKLLTKQERFEHASMLKAQMNEWAETIRGVMGTRDAAYPARVQDVMINDDGMIGRPVY